MAQTLESLVERKYSYLTIRMNEFKDFQRILRAEASQIADSAQFSRLALYALSMFKDCHMRIASCGGYRESAYGAYVNKNYDHKISEGYLRNIQTKNPVVVGMIRDIPYLRIDSFSHNVLNQEVLDWLKIEGQKLPHKDRVIIDIRANGGGSDGRSRQILYMFRGNEGPVLLSHYLRYRTSETNPDALTEFSPVYLDPNIPMVNSSKIALLIGQKVFSAAEGFAMNIEALPGSVLIGDTTGGGTGCPQGFLLDGPKMGEWIGNNMDLIQENSASLAVDIPSWLMYDKNKRLIEGRGIAPHVTIPYNESIVNGRDVVLEKALDVLGSKE